jgi:hypothetical protein
MSSASAQFYGVAEMIESVDFEKSVDYWQQVDWSISCEVAHSEGCPQYSFPTYNS